MTALATNLPRVYRADLSQNELELISSYVEAAAVMHAAIHNAHCENCSEALGRIAGNILRRANEAFAEKHGGPGLVRLDERFRKLLGKGDANAT